MKTMESILQSETEAQRAYERATIATADGLTIADLRTAFDQVVNPEGWKLPIDHTFPKISVDDRRKVALVVEFFTGSKVEWTSIRRTGNRISWRAQAAGYYAAIGA